MPDRFDRTVLERRAVAAELRAEELLFLLRRALRWVDSCPMITTQDDRDATQMFDRLKVLGIEAEEKRGE